VVAQTCDRIAVMYGGRLCEVGGKREVLGGPCIPIPAGSLIVSRPAKAGREVTIIDGQPPSADHFPSGCRFHPRCRRADEACQSQPLLRYGQDCHSHAVACHHILPARQEG
jgi:peptide/nickel transport system ATP-binding protein